MRAPIHSNKHYVQRSNVSVATGTVLANDIVDAIAEGTARGTTDQVTEGSVIKACFVELWCKSDAASGTSVQQNVVLEKVSAGVGTVDATEILNLGAYPNKKNVLFTSQGNLGDLTTQAVPIMRGWYKIPKGKQRFGLGDKLVLTVGAVGASCDFCAVFIYKEYN